MTILDPLAELSRLHAASFGWALGCCAWDREEAQEVLQAVYLKVLSGEARFAARASFKTWLFGVIRRTAAERRRRRWLAERLAVRFLAAAPPPAPAPTPEALAGAAERARALRRALLALPARQREVLLLVFYHGLSVEEAAAVLRIGVGSTRTHYHRGKERLRGLLREERG